MKPAKYTFNKVIKLDPTQASKMRLICDELGVTENEYIRTMINKQIKKDIIKLKKDNV